MLIRNRLQGTETDSPETTKKSDNIDLFAAGPRMPQVKPVKSLVPPPMDQDSGSSDNSNSRRSVDDMNSSPSSRNSKVELQAELLRLEAEKEQLEIDRQRLDEEKVITKNFNF